MRVVAAAAALSCCMRLLKSYVAFHNALFSGVCWLFPASFFGFVVALFGMYLLCVCLLVLLLLLFAAAVADAAAVGRCCGWCCCCFGLLRGRHLLLLSLLLCCVSLFC